MKLITMGMALDTDFGHPSLLHGLYELLVNLYGEDFELTHYQFSPINESLCGDFSFQVKSVPISYKQMFFLYIKWRIHKKIPKDAADFFEELKNADLVVDPFGIRFCDKFSGNKSDFYNMMRYYFSEFMPFLIARSLKKTIIKTAASYGEISKKSTKKAAKYIGGKVYTELIARENQSKDELINNGGIKKNILVSPDLANLFEVKSNKISNRVGISISFQIERQFTNKESYVQSMCEFCEHIYNKYNMEILLIPNQTLPKGARDDVSISMEVHDLLLGKNVKSEVIDIQKMSSTELKTAIASCSVLVGSRYHSCVAALSSGVPVLVIGWHHKYVELLELYLQSDMLIDVKKFSLNALLSLFDKLWETKEMRYKIIEEQGPKVRSKIKDVSKEVFNLYGKKCK